MPDTATVQITMPEMGESVSEGIVLEGRVSVGDFVNEGDTVVEVSTDKVDAEVPAPMSGTITALLAEVDDEVPVGQGLAEIAPGDGDGAASDAPAPAEPAPAPADGNGAAINGGTGNGADVKATPIARRVAAAEG